MSLSSISLSGINSQEAEHYHERSSSRRNSKWVIDVKEELEKMDKLNEVDHWEKKCIYQIPACVKDLNKKAYEPQAVSFGPYHHGEDHLNQMEKHKHRALLHFLRRSNKPIESYIDALHRVGKHLIASYDWLDEANNDYRYQYGNCSDQFLQLMVLDGCFMLEILQTATGTINDYAFNDPIFSYRESLYIMPYIRRDMLMLQNQLPMLLLDTLLAVETGGAESTTTGGKPKNKEFLNRIIIKFFTQKNSILSLGKCLHIIDVYRKHLLQGPRRKLLQTHLRGTDDHSEISFDVIRSARDLYEAGIRFKTSKTTSLRDISFRGGVLRLPVIVVDDTTESTFLNLMAYERFRVGPGQCPKVFFLEL